MALFITGQFSFHPLPHQSVHPYTHIHISCTLTFLRAQFRVHDPSIIIILLQTPPTPLLLSFSGNTFMRKKKNATTLIKFNCPSLLEKLAWVGQMVLLTIYDHKPQVASSMTCQSSLCISIVFTLQGIFFHISPFFQTSHTLLHLLVSDLVPNFIEKIGLIKEEIL